MDSLTLSLRVRNQYGMLLRIVGLLTARGYELARLALEESDASGLARLTLVLRDRRKAERAIAYLSKLKEVVSIDPAGEEGRP